MSRRTPGLYLEDILGAIKKIEQFTQGMAFEQFEKDDKTVFAVTRALEIIGEAAKWMPSEVVERYPDVPWERMISMRNKVTHEYFGIDTEILWQTICEDLPPLKTQLQALKTKE